MSILRIAGFAILAAAASLTVRAYRPEMSMQIGLACGLLILIYAMDELGGVYSKLAVFVSETGIQTEYIEYMLKITGIVYLMQFASDACRDAGESGLAAKTELAGRIMILAVCVPMIRSVFSLIAAIGPGGNG